jgi:phosphate transport system substrate-binding protein
MFGRRLASPSLVVALSLAAGCGSPAPAGDPIVIDGSSTVFPFSDAVAAQYRKTNQSQPITVTSSSTGVGLKRFCAGELDIADAPRGR